jgi:hypothetical protein
VKLLALASGCYLFYAVDSFFLERSEIPLGTIKIISYIT